MFKYLLTILVALTTYTSVSIADVKLANKVADEASLRIEDYCSATVINKEKRLVATANHCVEMNFPRVSQKVQRPNGHEFYTTIPMFRPIQLNKEALDENGVPRYTLKYTAKVLARDKKLDVAILQINETDVPILGEVKISWERAKRGDTVYTIGSPIGLPYTISQGILMSDMAYWPKRWGEASEKIDMPILIFDASAMPGNSGGTLINDNGEMIGIVCWRFGDTGRIGGATPINNLKILSNNFNLNLF